MVMSFLFGGAGLVVCVCELCVCLGGLTKSVSLLLLYMYKSNEESIYHIYHLSSEYLKLHQLCERLILFPTCSEDFYHIMCGLLCKNKQKNWA